METPGSQPALAPDFHRDRNPPARKVGPDLPWARETPPESLTVNRAGTLDSLTVDRLCRIRMAPCGRPARRAGNTGFRCAGMWPPRRTGAPEVRGIARTYRATTAG